MVFTADELDYLLQANAEKLTVVEASLTWCRPCMSFERTFEVCALAHLWCLLAYLCMAVCVCAPQAS